MPWTFEESRAGYGNLWRTATVKGGADSQNAETFAAKILAAEDRYRAVEAATGVPRFLIGSLHMRESSCDFAGVLHNGQKIIGTGQRTTLVPAGRGPFSSWEESAIDALRGKGLDDVPAWPVERMLYEAERYNGWGYAGRINSPYVWAGTNHEQTGKYVADHVWDPSADDRQLGVAAVLKRLAEKRPDIAAALASQPQPAKDGEILDPIKNVPAGLLDGHQLMAVFFTILQRVLSMPEVKALVVPVLRQMPDLKIEPVAPPPPAPTAPAPPVNPVTKGSLLAGLAALLGGGALQLNGTIAPPVGETATLPGIITTLAPIAIAAFGGPIGGFVSRLFSGISFSRKTP
jgi:lysozyme family protein